MPHFDHFEINIVAALADQLVGAFDSLEPAPLHPIQIDMLPTGQGVYQLFHRQQMVYVGKSDGKLPKRLTEHELKIRGRRNISVGDVQFRCLYIHPNWAALAPEESLIRHYRSARTSELSWNGNGFGPHDPGRERETTNKSPDGFDAQYPIEPEWTCGWIKAGRHNCKDLLRSMKKSLPYLLRYETAGSLAKGHPDYNDLVVEAPNDGLPAFKLLTIVAKHLKGWQATMFPSHMILYREVRRYTHGTILWPR